MSQFALADPGAPGMCAPPQGPNSLHFPAKNLQNNRLAHPVWELVPHPQENPGSATIWILYDKKYVQRVPSG